MEHIRFKERILGGSLGLTGLWEHSNTMSCTEA